MGVRDSTYTANPALARRPRTSLVPPLHPTTPPFQRAVVVKWSATPPSPPFHPSTRNFLSERLLSEDGCISSVNTIQQQKKRGCPATHASHFIAWFKRTFVLMVPAPAISPPVFTCSMVWCKCFVFLFSVLRSGSKGALGRV